MTFDQFYKSLLKRWYIVIICAVCVGLGAYVGSGLLLKPVYASSAKIQAIVRTGGDPLTSDNILASQNLAATEADLATTYPVLSAVAAHYPGLSASDLSGEVTATSATGSPLITITVQDRDPTQAAAIANDVANTLIQQQLQQVARPATEGAFLVVVEPARPASVPVRPNKTLNGAAGLLIGLLVGAILAVILESLDTRVRTKDELSSLLDWPVLASIWKASHREVIINSTSYNVNADSFSILHTNIGFAAADRPLHTLVVTSGTPDEGKTVVAANLAISMAIAGKKTLLVDANLHHPMLSDLFSIPPQTQGFTNAIVAYRMSATANPQQGLMPFIRTVNIPHLSVMPSGPLPPVPSEMLASNAMQGILNGLNSSGFEVVVFDAPSLLGLSDAAVLASKVDGTIVVVDITDARRENLKQTKEMLERAGAHVVGYVTNKQPQSGKSTPYKHSSYPRDAAIANQNIEYTTSPASAPAVASTPKSPMLPAVSPKPAAPITPVTWSTPRPSEISAHGIPPRSSEISSHGIPPRPSEISAHGIPPQPSQNLSNGAQSQNLSNGVQFKPSQNSSHGITQQKDR